VDLAQAFVALLERAEVAVLNVDDSVLKDGIGSDLMVNGKLFAVWGDKQVLIRDYPTDEEESQAAEVLAQNSHTAEVECPAFESAIQWREYADALEQFLLDEGYDVEPIATDTTRISFPTDDEIDAVEYIDFDLEGGLDEQNLEKGERPDNCPGCPECEEDAKFDEAIDTIYARGFNDALFLAMVNGFDLAAVLTPMVGQTIAA
jgi:hypothetical protein